MYRGADKSLALPGRKQALKHVRDARDFNNIEKRAVIKFFFLQGKTPKEIHAILTETSASFLRGRPKDLSAPLYLKKRLSYPAFLVLMLLNNSWEGRNFDSGFRSSLKRLYHHTG